MIKISLKKQKLNTFVFATCGILSVAGFSLFSLPVKAATEATVTATVTVQNISVSVTDGTVAYGTLGLNSSLGTNAAQTQTATNDGNVLTDLLIKGQDTAAWTLQAAAGANQYVHRYCVATCGTAPTNYTALTLNNQTLSNDLAVSGNQTFDLYLTTPTSSASYTQQSVNVTVTATSAS